MSATFFPETFYGSAGGGGGGGSGVANGTWTYDSGAAGLTFGTVPPGTLKTILFTGVDPGNGTYLTRVVVSGTGLAGFSFYQVIKNGVTYTLSPPKEFSDGDEFPISVDDDGGATWGIAVQAAYVDGTEQTATVELYDGNGTLVDTITASATTQDALLAEAVAQGADFFYSARDVAVGALVNTDVVMTDILGGEPDMVAVLPASSPDWEVIDSDPIGTNPSTAKAVNTNTRGPGAGVRGANATGLSGNVQNFLVIYKRGTSWTDDITICSGGSVADGAVADGLAARANTLELLFNSHGYNAGIGHSDPSGWIVHAYRTTGVTGNSTVSHNAMLQGGTWNDIGSNSIGARNTLALRNSVRFLSRVVTGAGTEDNIRVAAVIGWYSNASEAAMQAVAEVA